MKKLGLVLCVVLFLSLLMSSCKIMKDCPAYSQDMKIEVEKKV